MSLASGRVAAAVLARDLGIPGGVKGLARDLVRIPSPSGDEERAVRRVADEMRALGLDDVEIDAAGNAVGFVRSRHPHPRSGCLVLNSHLDHVDAGEPSSWTLPPFEGTIASSRLHGRGSSDAKSCVAAQVHAAGLLRVLRDEGAVSLRHDVVVTAVVQEEIGGLGAAHLASSGLAPKAAVIGEPSLGALAFGHRGRVEVEVSFLGRAGHASRPALAASPHPSLARFVLGIDDLEHDEAPRLGRSSAAATLVRAMPAGVNVIPGEIRVTLDWRNVPSQTPEIVRARVAALAEASAAAPVRASARVPVVRTTSWRGMTLDLERVSRPFATSPEGALFESARATLASGLGRDVDALAWEFATDGGWLEGAGAQCIGYGPGDMSCMHATDESVSLPLVEEAVAGNVLLLCSLDESLAREDA